jgi:hypothetical protein
MSAAGGTAMSKWKYLIVGVALLAAYAVSKWPAPIRFGGFNTATLAQQLTPLFLVSLLIERALEVFLTTWRAPKAARLQREVDKATELAAADATKLPAVQKAQDELTDYKSATQQIAMPAALVLGLLTSALGIRCLGNLVDSTAMATLRGTHPAQVVCFNLADVLLTGALVGGGSDVVHSFITAFTNFMNPPSKPS